MPESWSRKKRALYDGQPHQQKPDLDNLVKAVLDAIYGDDSGIWDTHSQKRWTSEAKGYFTVDVEPV
jgi:Holliday junction resolvase RusA-like endonuclease